MFTIYDGRAEFYQWDKDRKLIVEDSSIKQVHFCNKTEECSLVVDTYTENGKTLANVPNTLLQTDWKINVYGYTGDYTKHSATFKVNTRTKPTDYVYTETEIYTIESAVNKGLEEAKESGAFKGEPGAPGKDGECIKITSSADSPTVICYLKPGVYVMDGTFRFFPGGWTSTFNNAFTVVQKDNNKPYNNGWMFLIYPASNAIHLYVFDEFNATLCRGDLKYLNQVPLLEQRIAALEARI